MNTYGSSTFSSRLSITDVTSVPYQNTNIYIEKDTTIPNENLYRLYLIEASKKQYIFIDQNTYSAVTTSTPTYGYPCLIKESLAGIDSEYYKATLFKLSNIS